MRRRRSHIGLHLLVAWLVAGSMLGTPHSYGQTAPGTRILNTAKGVFLYKSGARDSLRSNTTETLVQATRPVASSIQVSISPDALVGNGVDTATVLATVQDATGNPVMDGAIVSFAATSGTFAGGKDTISLPTANGMVRLTLASAVVSQQIVRATITATTMGAQNQELTAVAATLFFPGALTGSVASALTGQPVTGAVVVVSDASQNERGRDTTGASGKYLIPVAAPGTYTQTITCRNRFGDLVQGVFQEQLSIPAHGGIPPTGLMNALAGNVIDYATGNPMRQAGIPVVINKIGKANAGGRSLPAMQTTDARGVFQFDSLSPGVYEIRAGQSSLSGTAVVYDTLASCFLVDVSLGVSEVPALQIVKSSSKRIAEIGDAVAYLLEIKNASATALLTGIRIVDDLPLGFQYVAGSSRHERAEVADPLGSHQLRWTLSDTLEPGKTTKLSYMTTIGSGAMEGDGVNHAFGVAQTPTGDSTRSAVASVTVVVRPGIFTDHGIVIGKIFFEINEDGIQEYGEKGIAGVELWMEDGTHIVTGEDGKYSLPDVRPGQHVIRVDRRTLPAGSEVLATETESAGDATTRFVRLVDGGIARADFRIRPPHQASLELSVSPAPSAGRVRASFVARLAAGSVPTSVVLSDTLPKGLVYDLQSITLNRSAVPGRHGLSRTLHIELPVRQSGWSDTVRVEIGRDSNYSKRVGVMRPKLTLSYPRRRDAVFGTVETFAVPTPTIRVEPDSEPSVIGAPSVMLQNAVQDASNFGRPTALPPDAEPRGSDSATRGNAQTPKREGSR